MELKNLEALKEEIAHLEEAERLVEMFENCFNSYYEFRDFVIKNTKYISERERNSLWGRLDEYFDFDDEE